MRLFLAAFPTSEAQTVAHAAGEALRSTGDGVSWVKRENLHYTLRFLGDLDDVRGHQAGEAAIRAAATHRRFEAELGALGAFPSDAPARVLWVGLARGGDELQALASSIVTELRAAGLGAAGAAAADPPFSAHLTLGRVRNPGRDWAPKLAAAPSLAGAPGAAFRIERVCLIESTLSPRGSVYRIVEEAPLAGA